MHDLCAIGNACIDIAARVDDRFLAAWQFPKSICTYLELERADALEAALPAPAYIPGGCGANTAATISALGGKAAFIGRVAKDAIGARFTDDMHARAIRFTAQPDAREGAGSTRIFALTTPDAERSFAAYYGVQEDLSPADIDQAAVRGARFLYLDGYALNSRYGAETFLAAAQLSRQAGKQVVLSPSDLSILTRFPGAIADLTAVSDIILCNEQEALALTGLETLDAAITGLQQRFAIGAVTTGERGVLVFGTGGVASVPAARPPAPVIDTNGAGDAFAGGFLFGLACGWDIVKAAALGNRCAAAIITTQGARPPMDLTSLITQ